MKKNKILWTKIDEAPALATYSLLPVLKAYLKEADIEIEEKDISLSGRVIANFPDNLKPEQKMDDSLTELGGIAKTPEANIVKLPNISASIPQLQATINELKEQGYNIPDYPQEPQTDAEKKIQLRFSKVLGSAVNPVLREGNSDRRPALSVKKFAQKNPHKMMKPWPQSGSKTNVAHMMEGDFFGSEKSMTLGEACTVKITFQNKAGKHKILKENITLQKGEVIDTAVMNVKKLREFYRAQIDMAKKEGQLLSLHLKATMMKVSDPIMFGHAVSVYFEEALEKHKEALTEIGANVNNGMADIIEKLNRLPEEKKNEVIRDINAVYKTQPSLAMVNSYKGITNLHVPNDVIIDASMPNVVRDGGKMWNKADELQDTLALIPDRSYATMYKEIIEDCKLNGQFSPATMGSVSNVGLMAQKAEEYGSHDKTFTAEAQGRIWVADSNDNILLEQTVEEGDIFRMCQVKDAPIKDWVKLAVSRAKDSGSPAVFWLNEERSHDAEIIKKVNRYLLEFDTGGVDIRTLKPVDAMKFTLKRSRNGENTISVTGNVLRDYLTDLFPILELGTSARMLSIVPLMNGGGLFETGAGGSAPKHVQQFVKEGHLRWDSLGEYCALVPSLELIAKNDNNTKAAVFAKALDGAISQYLENGRTPSRKVNEIDNRGSSFYLAMYWAKELAAQNSDNEIKAKFTEISKKLSKNEERIHQELLEAQGTPVELGGYFHLDHQLAEKAMRPSETYNSIIDNM
jgi:isocitrate dehydrogenase